MNKQSYILFRQKLNLKPQRFALIRQLFIDAALITACVVLPWYLAIPVASVMMFRQFSLMHDAVHGLVSKNKFINDIVGTFAGILCVLPYAPWKAIHLEHHYWSGNIEKDPVMGLLRSYPTWPKPLQLMATTCWRMWVPTLALFQYFVFWIHSVLNVVKHPTSINHHVTTILPLATWAFVISWQPQYALHVLLPAVTLYLLAVEVVNFPHHIGLAQGRGDKKLAVWEQHQIARSCTYPKWISQFIVLNFNYHIEHHMFPDAAWYHLDQIHHYLKTELKDAYNTDPQFVWIKQNRPKDLADLLFVPQSESTAAEILKAS
jgi:acyl-lipid omega-6 desaturase (Delta-12 desaturase)